MSSVLLVDDAVLMRHGVAERLRAAGHSVPEAADVTEAAELLAGTAVDVMVIEPDLIRGSGMDFAETVRGDRSHKILPIVFYTKSNDPKLVSRSRRMKTVRFLKKDQTGFKDLRVTIEHMVAGVKDTPTVVVRSSRTRRPRAASSGTRSNISDVDA